jgi:CheY-like chemotaxis protein
MGEDIHVDSGTGRGTTFVFDIQCEIGDSIDNHQASIINRVVALEPDQPRYRLLIVDDKPGNRKLLVNILIPFDFEIQEASNGQEAFEIWEDWEPHLIWMDMRMPVMNGYEATKQIRRAEEQKLDTGYSILDTGIEQPATSNQQPASSDQHPVSSNTVIIAVTASGFEEDRAVALSTGCDDFLCKPFQAIDVFDLMNKHLGVRFVYEEEKQSTIDNRQSTIEKVLTPDTLAALPDELRIGLQQVIEVIDIEGITSLIERIRQQNEPLAEALAELVKNYRFDTLQELFEEIE